MIIRLTAIALVLLFSHYYQIITADEETPGNGEQPPAADEEPVDGGDLVVIEPPKPNWKCNKERATISKDSVQLSDFETNDEKVVCIYTELKMESGKYYFDLKVEKSNFESLIGLGIEDILEGTEDDSNIKGLFYNDNLSNGKQTLIYGFGDPIDSSQKENDVVSFLVEIDDSNVKVSIKHENYKLGAAFQIPKPESPLFPVVIFSGNGMVTYECKNAEDESEFERQTNVIEGKYNIEQLEEDDEVKTENECDSKVIQVSLNRKTYATDNAKESYDISYENGKRRGILQKEVIEGSENPTYEFDFQTFDESDDQDLCIQFLKGLLYSLKKMEQSENKLIFTSQSKKLTAARMDESSEQKFVTTSPFS